MNIRIAAVIIMIIITLGGCAELPVIKDGELELSKDMSAGLEDDAVARITNRF